MFIGIPNEWEIDYFKHHPKVFNCYLEDDMDSKHTFNVMGVKFNEGERNWIIIGKRDWTFAFLEVEVKMIDSGFYLKPMVDWGENQSLPNDVFWS